MTKKILIVLIILILILGGTILAIRFLTSEDTWICQNGQWIKHGEPISPSPTTPCPGAKINQNINNNINSAPVKESNIQVENPKANELIASPYEITGLARTWYFEASFPIKLLDTSGKEIAVAIAQAQGEWMTTDWVPFKAKLEFLVEKDQDGTLVFMKDNPSGLSEYDEKFEMPVKLKGSEIITVKVYFGNKKLNPEVMDCRLVYPVERKIAKTTSVAKAALEELLKGPTQAEKDDSYFTSINENVKIQRLVIENGTAYVDFDEQLEFQVGGSCRVSAIRAQITETLKQFTTVKNVIISINGRTEDILQP